jgi:putative sterol carrier protein
MPTVKETFDAMPETFQPEAAAGMNEVFQFDITGEGGAKWYAEVNDGKLSVVEGQHAEPSLVITMATQDYLDMVEGKLHGQVAFMTGKLKLKGDFGLAVKMNKIFKR